MQRSQIANDCLTHVPRQRGVHSQPFLQHTLRSSKSYLRFFPWAACRAVRRTAPIGSNERLVDKRKGSDKGQTKIEIAVFRKMNIRVKPSYPPDQVGAS